MLYLCNSCVSISQMPYYIDSPAGCLAGHPCYKIFLIWHVPVLIFLSLILSLSLTHTHTHTCACACAYTSSYTQHTSPHPPIYTPCLHTHRCNFTALTYHIHAFTGCSSPTSRSPVSCWCRSSGERSGWLDTSTGIAFWKIQLHEWKNDCS